MNRLFAFTSFFLILSTVTVFSQVSKYSNEFMAIGVGARSLGMSNTSVVSVNDVSSSYWNPAGLVQIDSELEVMFMHSNYFAGIAKYDYGGISTRIDKKTRIGASFIRFGVDDIPNTLELIDNDGNIQYDKISMFSIADYGVLLSFSRKTDLKPSKLFSIGDKSKEKFNYGVNLKIIRRKAAEFGSAWGFGLDIGAQYFINKWQFGIMGRDITSTFNAWTFNTETFEEIFTKTGNEVPENSIEITAPRIILGAAREIKINDKISVLPEIDIDFTFDGKRNTLLKSNFASIDPHMGVEVSYGDFVFLRGGFGNIQEVKDWDGNTSKTLEPNFGLGIKIKKLSFDYALTNIGDQSSGLYSNVISLKIRIDKKQ